jgi:hypothetical protein
MNHNDITLLVGTCDRYSFLWSNFVFLFEKYWDKNIKIEKFFLSEEKSSDNFKNFSFITAGKIPYSDCLLYALNKIKTPYILWLQDDFFLRRTLTKDRFDFLLDFAKNHNVDRLGICEDSIYYTKYLENGLFRLDQYSDYTISMQPSIWNVDFLKSCLIPNENPWQFEVDGSQRLNRTKIHNIYIDFQSPPWQLEAMRKGQYTDWFYQIKNEENLT